MSQLTSNPTESGWRRTAECKTTTRNFNLSAELHSSGNSLFRAHRINLNEGFTFNFARWIVLILICFAIDSIEPANGGAVVATTKEAYFNGSAYLRLLAPMPIWDHSAISFRSCRGGDILTQQYNKNSIAISVLNDFLQVSLAGPSVVAPNSRVDVNVQFNLLDNQWHTLQFKYEYGVLYLYVDRRSIVFANSTYNSQFLTNQDIGNEAAILILGSTFTGCMLDGPGLQFVNGSTVQNVVFGPCPLTVGPCGNYGDTLIRPSQEQNFCINDPCMGKGVCLSLADGYDCRCTARYTGKNCQIDNGPPCAKNPCANGSCIEDNRGDFVCICSPNHTGQFCESTINLHPLCQTNPCMNNGVCSVVEGNIQCECQKSFSGSRCEIEIDDCLSQPCLNNGRCIDLLNGFRCDCHDTGYTGPLCQTNIDECTQSSNPCMNGRCFDTHGWYICECQRGWGGENCDKVISCETYKCLNGGTCGNDYQCDCPSGYSGELCQLGPPCPQCPIDSQCIAGKCVCNPGSTADVDFEDMEKINEISAIDFAEEVISEVNYFNETKKKRYIPPEWLKKKRCELQLSPIGHCTSISTTTVATEATLLSSSWPVKKPTPLPTSSHLIAHRPATHQPQTPRSAQLNACSKLCLNGGTCINVELGSSNDTCICASGFTGNNCEIPVLDGVFNSHVMDCHHNGGKCQNGGTCSMNGTHCYCPNGYRGDRCEKMDPCSPSNCQEPWICNKINKCVCPENKSCAACAAHPCRNGGICNDLGNGDYECKCNRFWTGRNCTNDVDECAVQPNICRNGICKNEEGNYKCYCTPGYTGIHCDSDVDECLSHPCENGATCHNKINAYECVCQKGYEGINCETDIDECASNPCVKGSCMDLVNNFTCNCIPGMTGRFCEIDIDDCVSAPCEHGGRCIDELDGFHCDCASTGYDGRFCETNINECLTHQCTNGAECIDQINDYMCNCFPGYRGKDCEIDINECESNPCQFSGNCLERSNRTLYEPTSNMDLPEIFRNEFSFENASGYECICVPGITGRNCEVNINECESNPCSKHGTCNDGIGSYTCDCDPGFEGTYCEINIDECERFKPCGSHGTCIDETNDYKCDCDANYGGKNCSVPLTGCVSSPCHNSGICKPYLINETEHRFTCICQNGYQGLTCEKTTTISMVVSSLITVKTHREEGYDINLQFKTTLPNGVLAFGTSGGQNEPVSYILELINGRLNLHSSLLNKWEGVFIGSKLNDSNWHKVFVAINTSHLVLSANDEQAIFPVGSYETANGSQPAFPLTYLGGTIPNLKSYLRHLTHQPSSFVGCMQDIRVNDKWIFPEEQITDDDTILVNIQSGCPRSEQCNPNPCHSNGECSDLWHTFSCSCKRPHFGHNCEYNITAATFGHENTSHSAVIVETNDIARRAIRSILSISMFIRTRQPTGQVFYLGSDPRKTAAKGTNDGGDSFVAAELQGGELLVKLQFNGTPEAYTVGGNKLDNGYNHLIEVARNQALVQVKLNGTEYFRKTLSSTGLLDAQILYLGGPAPSIDNLLTPSMTDDATNSLPSDDSINEAANLQNDKDYFKGIIQDVKISNGSRTMIVELYPLNGKNLELPPAFGEVSIDRSSVLKGEVTDDLCRKYPCKHNAECQNTWNDYICTCPNGYKGKDCQEIEFCQLVTCPGQSDCQNLDDGYECLTNITFTGNEVNPLTFTLHRENPVASEESKMLLKPIVEIEFRTRTGGTLLYVESNDSFFEIGVNSRQVTVTWKLKQEFDTKRFTKEMPNLERSMEMLLDEPEWRRIYLRVQNGKLEGGWKGWESMVDPSPSFSAEIDQSEFQQLLSHSEIYLAGMPMESQQSHAASSKSALQGSQFKGCLGEARVGDLLLPYFSNAEMYPRTENVSVQPLIQFRLNSSRPEEGCILCFSTDCKNGGFCSAPTEKYSCQCMPGYEDDDCSTDIDECLTAKCENNGTCINMIADFECSCLPGYGGRYCQNDIDECASQPCHNGGSCTDLIAKYRCDCTEDYAGLQCDVLKQVTCENLPCKNGSICEDGFNASTGNNFTCFCMDGYEGPMCDIPFCEVQTCLNGGLCLTTDRQDPTCKCSLGYTGRLCEKEINECESKPCLNGGLCTDLIGSYECNCANTGFQGVNCETDVDECSKGLGYCGESGLCINQPGNFKCICTYGFCGIYCNVTDPCRTGVSVCMNGAECVEVCTNIPDYFCNCTEGFTGKNCSDLITPKEEGPSTADIAIIVIPVVVVLLLIGAALLGTFLVMARNKRATRGTYSPSAQEYCNPRLEMDSVLKPPPEERLI